MTAESTPRELRRGGLAVSRKQADIVDHVLDHPLTVVDAGAGSGKTHTTIATVLEILDRNPDVTVDRFVLITFTNDAAGELRRRLESALTGRLRGAPLPADALRWSGALERLPNAYIGTIHGFCRQILRAFGYGSLVARESDVEFSKGTISGSIADAIEEAFDDEGARPLMQELGTGWHYHRLAQLAREIYEHVRNRGLSSDEIAARTEAQPDDPGKPVRAALARLVRVAGAKYAAEKQREGKIDAADLLLHTADLLGDESEPGIVAKLARRYRYLFVDEFQDTDQVQVRIVDSLRPGLRGVLLVGDEKQSIYGFRGAISRLTEFARERGVTPLELNVSRRPTRRLLDAQNALFSSISQRYPALGQILEAPEGAASDTTPLCPVSYVGAGADNDLSRRIAATAEKIRALLRESLGAGAEARGVEPGDIALLFRSNWQLDQYEEGLTAILAPDVTVRRESGGQFFQRPEVIGAYRVLRLLVDYPNDVVLAQALRTPYLRVDASVIERDIMRFGRTRVDHITRWFEDNHRGLADKIRALRDAIKVNTVPELLEGTYREFGLREYHRERGELRSVNNLERLQEMARNVTRTEQALTLRAFVAWLQVRIMGGFAEPDAAEVAEEGGGAERPPYVRLMTVHKAKGLEFPIVVIPEVQARLLAYVNDTDFVVDRDWGLDAVLPVNSQVQSTRFASLTARDDDAERYEAMRILYVAVTRAQNAVVFVGSSLAGQPLDPGNPRYSWKDEIIRARQVLTVRGARFETPGT